MDWDLKVPASWDLAELEHDAGAAAAGPSGVSATGGRPECSVDLKLGGLGEREPGRGADRRSRDPAAGKAPASPGLAGAASKRQQCPSCAVDGCKADLSKCRDYHRRHKVCEAHSKTPVVVVAGREMRFCQQCSRFHLLAEFDETKRSCRKRLDGHNRRRRKPQLDPMTSASFITSQQGARFSPFTIPGPEANWPGKEGRRFPFLQEGEISFATGVVLEAPVRQPLLETAAAAPPESSGGGKMFFSDGLTTRALDSDCALSLLSAPGGNSPGVDVSRPMVRPAEQVPVARQPLVVPGPQFGSSSWFSRPEAGAASTAAAAAGLEDDEQQQLMSTVLGPTDTGMDYSGVVFRVGGEGSSDGASSSLPFSWQ